VLRISAPKQTTVSWCFYRRRAKWTVISVLCQLCFIPSPSIYLEYILANEKGDIEPYINYRLCFVSISLTAALDILCDINSVIKKQKLNSPQWHDSEREKLMISKVLCEIRSSNHIFKKTYFI